MAKRKATPDPEYTPEGPDVWLLFDLCNGDKRSRRYCWWFDSYKAAMQHRRAQLKRKHSAPLSMPVQFTKQVEGTPRTLGECPFMLYRP